MEVDARGQVADHMEARPGVPSGRSARLLSGSTWMPPAGCAATRDRRARSRRREPSGAAVRSLVRPTALTIRSYRSVEPSANAAVKPPPGSLRTAVTPRRKLTSPASARATSLRAFTGGMGFRRQAKARWCLRRKARCSPGGSARQSAEYAGVSAVTQRWSRAAGPGSASRDRSSSAAGHRSAYGRTASRRLVPWSRSEESMRA